ncbi:FAD:protein FMN transferase [Halobacteriovorax sp.]|uniref:FAD:protein FMN transferase n=1 Tax=Halobacteriovorax sp. TaxID=2020862 RepID=UPI00356445CB
MSALKSISSFHMNCSWEISYFPQPHLSENETIDLIKQTFKKVEDFENYFTVFKESPFNEINKNAGIAPVKVNTLTISLIKESIDYYFKTNYFFNICFLAPEGSNNPSEIEIDEGNTTVYLPKKEMRVSLGGIGKGYAVDMCYEFLKKKGMINFMVNGSGDLRVYSHKNSPRPWRIGITNPFNIENKIGYINLKSGSLATSGQYLKKNHIKTSSLNTPLAVTVRGEKTSDSDVLATYLSSLSSEEAVTKMERMKVSGFIIDRSGKVHRSTHSFKELSE